jgi:multiple sugar transport system substrate-binding protein
MVFARRPLFLIVALLIVALPVAAQNGGADEILIAPVPCEEPGTLTLWVWDEIWADVIGQSIEAWEADYCPGAEVEIVQTPWDEYWDTMEANAVGGDLPDVFNMSQDQFYFYAQNDAVLNMQPYWDAAEIDTTIWGTGLVDPYRWGIDGDLYAGPVNWDTVALFYNKDLFDAASLDYPTANWTWDDFANAAAALTDPATDVFGAAVYSEYQGGYSNWIASTDTSPLVDPERTRCTLNEPGSLEALHFLKALYDTGYMPSVSTMDGSSADDAFNFWAAGRVAMITGGSWKLPDAFEQIEFNWDVAQMPRNPETGISRPILHSVGYVAAANGANTDLAANLIIYLSSDEGQTFFAEAGGVAPANPALQDAWVASFGETDVDIDAFVRAVPDTQGVTVFAEIWDTINTDIVVNLFDANMPVAEAVAQACDQIVAALPE